MTHRGISRRRFLGQAATAGAVTAGFGLPALGLETSVPPKIVTRTLGRTGLELPVVSFGVMNSDSPDLLRRALDTGVRHLDTAHGYLRGKSEKVIGEVLQERGDRDRVIIATKMRFARDRDRLVFVDEGTAREPGATEENLLEQLAVSLQRLRTDYVDVLYLHSIYSPAMATDERLMNAMVKVKQAGKARFIGISTHHDEPNVIRAAADTGVYDVILTAYNFLQDHRDEIGKAIDYAAGNGVGVVAMKTQGGNKLNRDGSAQINHRAALKWVLSNPNVCTTIPGITTFDQLDLDVSVMADLELTADERRELNVASLVPGPVFCQNCRQCLPTCPNGVEVSALMRAAMYADGYGNLDAAGATLADLPAGRGLDVCGACAACRASCTRGIEIGDRVAALQRLGLVRC
jgi:aryl-alcohol dehydrogenase-like predicted oxidoreductase